ncbi:DNA topoisomerase [Paraburkholderia sp. EG287A]|uniref:DNA topoisomerase n=1 Tax=Paraburkholderia sp. EG287A TaxID=3237012 RepID=UPI0034D24D7B
MTANTSPNLAWTLVAIQAAAQQRFSYAPEASLQALYRLYEAGLITYPRTETAHLPRALFKKASKLVRKLQHWHRDGVQPNYQGPVWDDEQIGSHHGIVPCKASAVQFALADLSIQELNLYKLVCERFIELFHLPTHAK